MLRLLRNHGRSATRLTKSPTNRRPLPSQGPCARGRARQWNPLAVVAVLLVLLMVGCQGMGLTSDEPFSTSDIDHFSSESDESEIEVFNERFSSHVTHRPLTLREGFRRDAIDFWPMVGHDAKQIVTARNAAILGVALGGSLIIRDDLDGQVRRNTAQHPQRWGNTSESLGYLGNAEVQVPVLLAIHASSLMNEDEELHDLSTTMLSAYAINGLSTVAIKGVANTDRPTDRWNNGEYGFPSFHASSSTAIAAVLDEYYGPSAGLPAYALAGLIGWSRIDQRDHDLSDVVFGAAMGYVIGKSVARHHLKDGSQISVLPSVDPSSGSVELLVEVPF
ncbi:MAG: hypothetical protein ACI93T_003954 [Porticoccaceae bacterium]|jgi:hypothetical protein